MHRMRTTGMVGVGVALAALSVGTTAAVGQGDDRAPETRRIVFYPGQPQVGPTDVDVGPAGESRAT